MPVKPKPPNQTASPATPPLPPGYAIAHPNIDWSSVPRFIREGIPQDKVVRAVKPGDARHDQAEEYVTRPWLHPSRVEAHIDVHDPQHYSQKTENHELTHVYQDTRNQPIAHPSHYQLHPGERPGATQSDYHYGGLEGLEAALSAGKNVRDLTVDQQANLVADYQSELNHYLDIAKKRPLYPFEAERFARVKKAYHPFIQQMANLPGVTGGGRDIKAPPAPPGLPPADTPGLGILEADPLMAGFSQPLDIYKEITDLPKPLRTLQSLKKEAAMRRPK